MGFTIKIGELNREHGQGGVLRSLFMLAQMKPNEKVSIAESYNIGRMLKQLKKIAEELQPESLKILKAHVKLDEKGNIAPYLISPEEKDAEGKVTKQAVYDHSRAMPLDEEHKKLLDDEMDQFNKLDTPMIESHKLKLSELEKYKLSAMEILDLECLTENDLDSKQPVLPFEPKVV